MGAEQLLRDWVALGNEYIERRKDLDDAERGGGSMKDRARAMLAYHRVAIEMASIELALISLGETAETEVEP